MLKMLAGLDHASPCELKIQALHSANMDLWDVLHSCSRMGSKDASIDKTTQATTDFR